MRRTLMAAVAAAMMLIPAVAWAQRPEGAFRGHDPIARLIEKRAELGLTDEQVSRLEEIRARLEERNRPLLEELRAARPAAEGEEAERWREARARWQSMTPEERERARAEMEARRAEMRARWERMTPEEREARRAEMRQRMEERRAVARERMGALRPTLEQLRKNHEEAMDAVREVLTDEQEAKLRELHDEHRGERGKRPGMRSPRRGAGESR